MSKFDQTPFDSLTLAAVAGEYQELLGGKFQGALSLEGDAVALAIYAGGRERWALFSWSQRHARTHLLSAKPKDRLQATEFALSLRSSLNGARLERVAQWRFDRVIELRFRRGDEQFRLIAELMGARSNLILVDSSGRILGCGRTTGAKASVRPIVVGRTYAPPPMDVRSSIFSVKSLAELPNTEGASPFLVRVLERLCDGSDEALTTLLADLKRRIDEQALPAFDYGEIGAYPLDLSAVGWNGRPIASISAALEPYFGALARQSAIDQERQALQGPLSRTALAREAALHDLVEALRGAELAPKSQRFGELILAYQWQIHEGDRTLETVDYDGAPISIPLREDLSPQENATRYFDKARRAKAHAPEMRAQWERLDADANALREAMSELAAADSLAQIRKLRELAIQRRWLLVQTVAPRVGKAEPTFKIRSLQGPHGYVIMYGENATANDHLTLRVSKPNDIWLHVRGATSTHVVIQTQNKPDKVPREALEFAAQVAARNSASKHSNFVPVDYTLRKYVRKPKSAPAGSVFYTHEKTLHVDPSKLR